MNNATFASLLHISNQGGDESFFSFIWSVWAVWGRQSCEQLLLCYCRGQPFHSMQNWFFYAHQWTMVPHFSSSDSLGLSLYTQYTHIIIISVKVNNVNFTFRCNLRDFSLLVKDQTGGRILGRFGLYTVQAIGVFVKGETISD
jgi:hypothetical protein